MNASKPQTLSDFQPDLLAPTVPSADAKNQASSLYDMPDPYVEAARRRAGSAP